MSLKASRHREILKVVSERPVATQAELQEVLHGRGIRVDQATLSRDIRELGLVKTPAGEGGYRYAPVEEVSPVLRAKSQSLFRRFVRGIETSRNLIVIKTDPGNASAVGISIDRMGWPEVAGTIAGDDTLLVVVRESAPVRGVARKIKELAK